MFHISSGFIRFSLNYWLSHVDFLVKWVERGRKETPEQLASFLEVYLELE